MSALARPLFTAIWISAWAWCANAAAQDAVPPPAQGLVFLCTADARASLSSAMTDYLRELNIDPNWVVRTDSPNQALRFTLKTDSSNTLDLVQRQARHTPTEQVVLPGPKGQSRKVNTVSKQEILLALMHPGRNTQFGAESCHINALREHIGVRQNIVAWVEQLHWVWPDGGEAHWNTHRWHQGTPQDLSHLDEALLDAFFHQQDYAFGCYTASKLSYAHGILDYYQRVLQSPKKAQLVRQRLLSDKDPLINIEPSTTWNFGNTEDANQAPIAGKLLTLQRGMASTHFVPGDWIYLQNTDPKTQNKTGYEGSNAIYLGRGKFDDFYNDHRHAYTLNEKLDEVYQWRHGVFSRTEDAKKIRPLSAHDYERLSRNTEDGGLLRNFRLAPYLFGYEKLPLSESAP